MRVMAWSKPRSGYMKLNLDAGFDHDNLNGTVGAILRDDNGKFIAAANERLNFCYDSFSAEATAVRFRLNLAHKVGCSKIVVVSDNEEVVIALKEGFSSSVASAIFDDCYYMSLDFNHVLFDSCIRDNNQVAHELAKLAKFSPPSVCMDSPPDEIIPFLVNDTIVIE